MNLHDIIRRPLITEKSTRVRADLNCYVMEVAANAGKQELKAAVEKLFKVKVASINTATMPGKFRRMGRSTGGYRADWKKAYVRLQPGQEIKLGEESK